MNNRKGVKASAEETTSKQKEGKNKIKSCFYSIVASDVACHSPSLRSSWVLCSVVASNVVLSSAIIAELKGILQHCGLRRCVVVRHYYEVHGCFATLWLSTSVR